MEEAEIPLEHLHEDIHHHAEHSGEKWISWVALSTAILAVLAAIAGLLSGSHANEAMMKQIESADQWAFYQAKGIKAAVLDAKMSLTGSTSDADREKAEKYSEEQAEIQKEARAKEAEAKQKFHQHEVFARGVTLFQIAIAIAAISALTKRRRYWLVSMIMGAIGCIFLVLGAARGAAILAAAENGLPIFEYAPRRIKQATVGTGGARKNQVAFMMRALLGLTETPDADSADALAIALTHLRTQEAARLGIPGTAQI